LLEIVLLCAGCHGMAGDGRPEANYPPIAGQPPLYLERQLEAFADGRRESAFMSPIAKRLAPEERARAARHFARLDRPEITQGENPSRRGHVLATLGDEKLRVQACQNCHGPRGSGQPPSGPYLAGLQARYIKEELLRWRNGTRRSDPSGAMESIARRLTETDVDALAGHYGSP
jgi:cytochrome c553